MPGMQWHRLPDGSGTGETRPQKYIPRRVRNAVVRDGYQTPPTEAPYNIRIAPNKTRNPVMADPRHILSNVAMTLLPMPSHGSNNNGRPQLRLPSGSGLKNQIKSLPNSS